MADLLAIEMSARQLLDRYGDTAVELAKQRMAGMAFGPDRDVATLVLNALERIIDQASKAK